MKNNKRKMITQLICLMLLIKNKKWMCKMMIIMKTNLKNKNKGKGVKVKKIVKIIRRREQVNLIVLIYLKKK